MSLKIQCMRIVEFDAAHRVMGHETKCRTLHGHRYKVEIYAAVDELDDVGRVIDFGVLKQRIGGWIDTFWDHTAILHKDDPLAQAVQNDGSTFKQPYFTEWNPTAENMAKYLLEDVCQKMLADSPVRVVKVVVWETPNCQASAVLQ